MKLLAIFFTLSVSLTAIESCASVTPSAVDPVACFAKPKKNLPAFRSEYELKSFLKTLRKKRNRGGGGGGGFGEGNGSGLSNGPGSSSPMAMESTVTVTAGASSAPESVTNVQHAGVDEGGIVKVHGDHLVILRRGRLFTVSIKDNSLQPVSSLDAFGPDIDPDSSWYDEMLISGNTIVVIGFSYERGGTEVGLFNINDEGGLRYRSTYHLRSNDYYSSRNYSSRLIGDKLIFYAPLDLSLEEQDVVGELPAVRRWRKGVTEKDFKRIVPATRIYRGQQTFDDEDSLTLHTVTTCDLKGDDMSCEATAVLGPGGNVFYVSPHSVYVWAVDVWKENNARPLLYQLPLDGSAPSALAVSGSPVDQFGFLESEDGHLNVLVRSESKGDGMWAAETAEGDVALMRVAIDSFSDGSVPVAASNYRQLPRPGEYGFQNRFVGDYILYGTGDDWQESDKAAESSVFAAKWNGAPGIWSLPLPHGIDRIEPLGTDSIVIGTDGKDLHLTTLQLAGAPTIMDRYVFRGSSQGESRSHGFFYKSDSGTNGILGLPIISSSRARDNEDSVEGSVSMVFLENRSLRLKPMGELRSQPLRTADDGCKASCVDWYGNARPLFLRGRIFALLGYELVEGRVDGGTIKELTRTNFEPREEKTETR